jgi:hypothetical protein
MACSEDGVCVEEAPDAGRAPIDAGDHRPAETLCGTTDLLREDFEAPDPDRLRWVPFNYGPGIPPTISQGRAILSYVDGDLEAALGFWSARHYLFDESQVAVDAGGVSDVIDVETRFTVTTATSTIGFSLRSGQLRVRRWLPDDVVDTLASVPFAPVAQRYWRLREAGALVHFEVSPDGAEWTAIATAGSTPFARPVRVFFLIVEHAEHAGPSGQISIDDINLAGDPVDTTWCPIERLSDDFDDPAVDPTWVEFATGATCTAAEVDGVLRLTNPTAGETCGYRTALGQILRDRSVSVEAARPGTGKPDLTFAVQLGGRGERIAFHHRGGTAASPAPRLQLLRLRAGAVPGGPDAQVLLDARFDAVADRFWRFAHHDGVLDLETAPDGETWSVRRSLAEDLPVDDVFVSLETTEAGPEEVGFDNLSLPPPLR